MTAVIHNNAIATYFSDLPSSANQSIERIPEQFDILFRRSRALDKTQVKKIMCSLRIEVDSSNAFQTASNSCVDFIAK
jgi:hypothetical protein